MNETIVSQTFFGSPDQFIDYLFAIPKISLDMGPWELTRVDGSYNVIIANKLIRRKGDGVPIPLGKIGILPVGDRAFWRGSIDPIGKDYILTLAEEIKQLQLGNDPIITGHTEDGQIVTDTAVPSLAQGVARGWQDELRQKCADLGFPDEQAELIVNRENDLLLGFTLWPATRPYNKRILERDIEEQVLLLIDEYERVEDFLASPDWNHNVTDYIYHRLFSLSGNWPDFEMRYMLKKLKRKGWVHTNIERFLIASNGAVVTYYYSDNTVAELTAEGERQVADIVRELQRGVSETGQQDHDAAEASKFAHHKYDTAKLREKIKKAFDDDEFTAFCFDHFRLTYDKFSTGMTRLQKIQLLIEDCDRGEKLDELLRLLK